MSTDLECTLLSFLYLAVAVLAPIVVYRITATLARRVRRRQSWARAGGALLTLATVLTISPLAFLLAICSGPPPGESDAATAAKARARTVIIALERYDQERGRYPAALDSLVPDYLSAQTLPLVPAQHSYPFEYRLDSAGYELSFRYSGPGMNYCDYRPSARRWHCGGYF